MKLFAAMSGGVDSAVAALLLTRAGHDVVGIHLRTGVKAGPTLPGARPRCCGTDEAADARHDGDADGADDDSVNDPADAPEAAVAPDTPAVLVGHAPVGAG